MLRQITYVSTIQGSMTANGFLDIERHAQRNNALNGLSGLLMFDGRRFLQVLEGEPAAVQSTDDRIERDPRHFALVILSDRPVSQASFGGWAMLCRDFTRDDTPLAEVIRPFVRGADKSTRALFESFARIREKRAA